MKYVVGNWKSNKNEMEIRDWFMEFSKLWRTRPVSAECTSILCPPDIYLSLCSKLIREYSLPLLLGAQNISPFGMGSYTGEVAASQVREYAQFVMVGHSERRNHFNEDASTIDAKVKLAKKADLRPILCIQGLDTPIPPEVSIVAYEPVKAIGTGKAEESSEAEAVAEGIRSKYRIEAFLYGGSVDENNVTSYMHEQMIDGVLVGGASLEPLKFWNLIQRSLNKS